MISIILPLNKNSSHPYITVLKRSFAKKSTFLLLNGYGARSILIDSNFSKRIKSSFFIFVIKIVSSDSVCGESVKYSWIKYIDLFHLLER